jgi:uncharacterized membrane protein
MRTISVIPIFTIFAYSAIFLNIPIFRDCILFIYLSFIPGFALFKFFKLKETSFLDTILFSVGLSIVFLMLIGLIVNELYVILGYPQPMSTIPLMVAISAFTLSIFIIEYRRDQPEPLKLGINLGGKLLDVLPLSILLSFLPIFSAIGVLYLNVVIMLVSFAIISVLCVICVLFRRFIPEKFYPFLIFSISVTLICQVLLISRYNVGWDSNLEYYVFRLTQIAGHWDFLNANVNSMVPLTYGSLLSITLLPEIYSVLMNAPGQIVFKILYPFVLSLIPLILYRVYESQFGKLIGLLSTLFFVFTEVAYFDSESLGLNRQIVGTLFLVLSIFVLMNKTMLVRKRRTLLIIFGVALALSHYALAFIYLAFIALLFIVSKVRPKFDGVVNASTIMLIFVITFSWYSLGSSSTIISLTDNIRRIFEEFTVVQPSYSVTSANMFAISNVFTPAVWINLVMTGITNLFLLLGILLMVIRPKGTGIFGNYRVILIAAAIILGAAFVAPSISSKLNFTRFYGLTLLFLSPCFVFGGQTIFMGIGKAWTKIKNALYKKRKVFTKIVNTNLVLLLIGVILCGYFLSQVGFVNRVTGGSIRSFSLDFDRMNASNDSEIKIYLHNAYLSEQDVFSASWLSNHRVSSTEVVADYSAGTHVLVSFGLVPDKLLIPLTDEIVAPQGSLIYLGTLNLVNGVIKSQTESFNMSSVLPLLDQNSLIYSNGDSEVWYATGT